MSYVKMNTQLVHNAANAIKQYNGQLDNNFSNVASAVSSLDCSWEGEAASVAIGKFQEIRKNYPANRMAVVDNYVNFLLQQVGSGYEQTEVANISLAERFK